MRLCSISVDLDEIPNYYALHGLEPPEEGVHGVYDWALQRFDDWATCHDLRLTLFGIGADMARPENAKELRTMAERGHEIANHTLDHRYDFSQLSREEMATQVEQGAAALAKATGASITGFRAPGYVVNDQVYEVLGELGVGYSSSVFPSPTYYAAKAASLRLMRRRGRQGVSLVDTPRVLSAPTTPYRVGRPYWRRGEGMWELPIQVTRGLRLPFIGTALTMAGPAGAKLLTRMVCGSKFVNLELHGIDLLDNLDDLEPLAVHQPDVKINLERKFDALTAAVQVLKKAGYGFVRLDEAVPQLRQG